MRSNRPDRAWLGRRRQFAILCVHTLLFQAVTFLLRPAASYRAVELDVPTSWLGFLAASFALVPLLVALPAGDAADRFGEGRILVLGALVVACSAVLYAAFGRSFAALLVATVVLGTGHLLCAVGQQAMVANLVPQGSLDRAFGYYTFAGSLGQAVGPGLLAFFGTSAALPDTDKVFLAAIGLALALLAVTLLARSTPRTRSRAPRADRKVRSLLRTHGLLRALLVSAVVISSMDITLVYLPALGAERGLAVGVVGGLLAARGLASMASRLVLGRLVMLVGRRNLLVSSIAASALAVAIVPFPVPLAVSFLALVVLGFGLGVCQPLTLSWLAEIAPPGLRGRVVSMRLVGNRFGQVVIPSLMGLLAAGLGAAGVLWLTAGALMAAATAGRLVPMDTRQPDD